MKKVLLYSNGLDSWLMSKLWNPDVKLYIDMNTQYSKEEISRLPKDVIVEKLDLGKWERPDSIIPLRNLILVCIATNYGDHILLGATKGDRVLDKSYEFAEKTTDLLRYLYSPQWWNPEQRDIKICLDYKNYTKTDLLKEYMKQGGDLKDAWEQSFSCYHPKNNEPCFCCKPCFRKFVAFAEVGFIDEKALKKVIPYIEKEILPQINAGTYGRGEEEEIQIKEIYERYAVVNS